MRKRIILLLIVVFSSVVFPLSNERKKEPEFIIDNKDPLMDEIINIKIVNLPPGKEAKISQESSEGEGSAIFLSDKKGIIDLTKHEPLPGSCYKGVNPMGIFLFEKRKKEELFYGSSIEEPISTELKAEINGKIVAQTKINRWWLKPDIERKEIRKRGFVSKLFKPLSKEKLPAIIVLGGSEGGLSSAWKAGLLASHGYITLALAYFKEEGLPNDLCYIPVEIVKEGIELLKGLPEVKKERIGIFGGSKGAELALLSASLFPDIKAVIAYVPSHVVWGGIRGFMGVNESSWTLEGKPLPFVPYAVTQEFIQMFYSGKPLRIGLLYESSLKNKEAVEKALIAVEKINGPVLLISGKDDHLWPSYQMAEEIMKRLKKFNHPYQDMHLSYDNAGHGIGFSFKSVLNTVQFGNIDLGGTIEGNACATLDSIPKVLKFLEENLKK